MTKGNTLSRELADRMPDAAPTKEQVIAAFNMLVKASDDAQGLGYNHQFFRVLGEQ